ncbi:hypothetical protein BZA05DRAFT_447802 [Tricharina praecox]|uniref:uncharacterized protein n=1 Tax=Tricharina praecox TaxID=43433 RepID=UPI0022206E9F|nr:uncharacterized protein BZA05DRAFT_447802 [Tricharina praecox]KAI5845478.1 hypothetical protein BZA05DRAFT_447802 [Tricharina praecox]
MQINLCILPILSTIAAVVSAAPSGILARSGSVAATSNNKANESTAEYHMIEIPGIDDAIANPEHRHENGLPHYTVVCKTSWASPTFDEIDNVVLKVSKKARDDCGQYNHGGSKCTRLQWYKGGALSLCGKAGWTIPCPSVAWAGQEIKNRCGNDDMQRAGGHLAFAASGYMRTVIH